MFWVQNKSIEVLPALSVRRQELRHSLRVGVVSSLYGAIFLVCISGVHYKNFALMLGFNDFEMGILTTIPFFAMFFQPFAAAMLSRFAMRKSQFLIYGTIQRLLWLGVAAIPLVLPLGPGGSHAAVVGMLLLVTMSWVSNAFCNPAWVTWMGDLVPRRIRGRYMALRYSFGRLVQILIVVLLGVFLDWVTVAGQPETATGQPVLLRAISVIFVIAAVTGVIEILSYRRIRDIVQRPGDEPGEGGYLRGMLGVFRDRGFLCYSGYGFTIAFASTVPSLFFWRYTTETLGFTKLTANVLYMVVAPILGMVGVGIWGKLLDRVGRKPVLILATLLICFSVMPYFFCTPDAPYPAFIATGVNGLSRAVGNWFGHPEWQWITPATPVGNILLVMVACFIGGVGWTGINMGQTNVLMGFSDRPGSGRLVAVSQVLISVGGMLGGLVGGLTAASLDRLQSSPIQVGPFAWNNWHVTFALSGLARIAALLWVIKMPEPGAAKVRDLVRLVSAGAYSSLSAWLFFPLRALRPGKRPPDAEKNPPEDKNQ